MHRLEQRCFALTKPREFATLSLQLERVQATHATTLYASAERLRSVLLADPVLSAHTDWVRVQARTKAPYSAYSKMERKGDGCSDALGPVRTAGLLMRLLLLLVVVVVVALPPPPPLLLLLHHLPSAAAWYQLG